MIAPVFFENVAASTNVGMQLELYDLCFHRLCFRLARTPYLFALGLVFRPEGGGGARGELIDGTNDGTHVIFFFFGGWVFWFGGGWYADITRDIVFPLKFSQHSVHSPSKFAKS